ncbi:hypothetical protein C1893_02175 [Pseudomonas sp. MPR-ANC1]|uniref:hypothetical protein n=1 Tax=Pseudomonas sp. MPR-ANC1 TaxID=2075548 RepID=UPI000CD18EC2|nr:hypothetical protein [Pseudomonas sp. MPR-ANC1]POA50373.1 hypothetical protein C1893_02175 [Pseudomonas sp. MPR-ANC1]
MSQPYNFLVAHLKKDGLVQLPAVSASLREWFGQLGVDVDRFGSNKSGKVVKFSEKSYEKSLLASESGGVMLYSERIWPKDECDESMNCNVSAIFLRSNGLLLSVADEVMSLDQLIESFWRLEGFAELFEYLYAYQETQGYGTGFGLGFYTPDESHPLMWKGRSQVGKWAAATRNAVDVHYIRDVFEYNAFSEEKLNALPAQKQSALESVMDRFGERQLQNGWNVWRVTGADQQDARKELIASDVLAAFVS